MNHKTKKPKFNLMFKIVTLVLVHTVLLGQFSWAGTGSIICGKDKSGVDTLSPSLMLGKNSFQHLISLMQMDKQPRLFTRKKGELYNIGNQDFIDGFYSGFWAIKSPWQDIFQSCTAVVFVDKNGQVFLSHIDADINADWEIEKFVKEWQAYPTTDAYGNLLPAFNKEQLFDPQTKVLIFNRSANSKLSVKLKEFLSAHGIKKNNIDIPNVPAQKQVNTVGLFFWPKDGLLEVSYAATEISGSHDIFQVSRYSLKDIALSPETYLSDKTKTFAEKGDNKENESRESEFDIVKLKDGILYNALIQRFFKLSQSRNPGRMPWSFTLHELLELEDDFMVKVLSEIEAKGEKWISEQAELIRETHSSRSSYDNTETGGSWTSFIEKNDTESYNLSHLLAHSIAFVKDYIEIGNERKAQEFLKQGYIILRAIEIESKTDFGKDKREVAADLDGAIFDSLDGAVIKSKSGEAYEIDYNPEMGQASLFRMQDGKYAGYITFYLQGDGSELFINYMELKKQGASLSIELLRSIIDLLPEGFKTRQTIEEKESLAYLENLYQEYGTDESGQLHNYDPNANLIGHVYFEAGLQVQNIFVIKAKGGTHYFMLNAWKEKQKISQSVEIDSEKQGHVFRELFEFGNYLVEHSI